LCYDYPLTGFFYQKYDLESNEDELIFSVCTGVCEVRHPDYPNKTRYSRGELLEVMEADGIVFEEHLERLALDLVI